MVTNAENYEDPHRRLRLVRIAPSVFNKSARRYVERNQRDL